MFKTKSTRALVLIVVLVAIIGLLGVSSKSVAAPTPVAVGIYCISLGHQRLECHADVSGGTGVYTTWLWTPTPQTGSTDFVIVRCAQAYHNQSVSLTVTDSLGAQGSDSTVAYCGDAQ
jgi:hypothetical protein